ncbi:MAG TPA: glycosyltransferase, partial [Stellaceae bacterium]|nr:glycosyltransferase [Stellaceae bacterium]
MNDAAALPATAADVTNLYHLVMRREPDPSALGSDPGRPFDQVFYSKLNSAEFLNRVVPMVLALKSPMPHALSRPFEEVRSWAAARLPVSAELRAGIKAAGSYEEILRQLLQDQSLIDSLPRLLEAGVDRLLRVQPGGDERLARAKAIRGEIIFAAGFEIRGWCANQIDLTERMIAEVFADNIFLGSVVCDRPLPALQQSLGGDGCHAFRFIIPGAFLERFKEERTVSIVERSTGVTIGSARLVDERESARSAAVRVALEIRELRERLGEIEGQLWKLRQVMGHPVELYDEYIRIYEIISHKDVTEKTAALADRPLLSFIVEIGGAAIDRLSMTVESIREQGYDCWELLLVPPCTAVDDETGFYLRRWEQADARVRILAPDPEAGMFAARLRAIRECAGDWFGFVGVGDRLSFDAGFWLAAAAQDPQVGLIYTDEDHWGEGEGGKPYRSEPQFKGAFDEDLLLSTDYIGNMCLYKRDLFDPANVPDPRYEEIFDYDLRLRAVERLEENQIRHVCRVLYHRRADAQAAVDEETARNGRRSLLAACAGDYLQRTGRSAAVEPHADAFGVDRPLANRVRWSVTQSWPSLSILIPTRDRMDLLSPCLDSTIAAIAGYRGPVEIVIIDNESAEEESKKALKDWARRSPVTLVPYRGEFSWSAINNYGVEHAKGDVLLFLNNDTLVLSQDWCDELVTQAARDEVGAVGARLLYQDGTLQHGGIILGESGVVHEGAGETPQAGGYL